MMRTRWRVRASPSHASARRTCGRRRRRAGLGRVAQAKDRASARERGRRGAYRAGWTSSRRARGSERVGVAVARVGARASRDRATPRRARRAETSSGAASGWWNCRARSRARPRSRGRVAASPATTSCEKSNPKRTTPRVAPLTTSTSRPRRPTPPCRSSPLEFARVLTSARASDVSRRVATPRASDVGTLGRTETGE